MADGGTEHAALVREIRSRPGQLDQYADDTRIRFERAAKLAPRFPDLAANLHAALAAAGDPFGHHALEEAQRATYAELLAHAEGGHPGFAGMIDSSVCTPEQKERLRGVWGRKLAEREKRERKATAEALATR